MAGQHAHTRMHRAATWRAREAGGRACVSRELDVFSASLRPAPADPQSTCLFSVVSGKTEKHLRSLLGTLVLF